MPSKSVVKRLTIQAPPGSDKALKAGCLCPVIDNAHGKGAWGTWDKPESEKVFWVNGDCPLHGNKDMEKKKDES
jgi:hypothetical protein